MNRHFAATVTIFSLLGAPAFARGNDQREIAWDDLQQIVGKKLRIAMPDGTAIEGKAIALAPDALAVQIMKTTNAAAYAKAKLLVPRATLKSFSINHPSKHWRVAGIALGAFVGSSVALVGGSGVATGEVFKTVGTKTKVAYFSAGGGMAALGYFLGKSADRRVTTYVIAP